MPRFAILRMKAPQGLHWDLLLESGAVLRAWALPQPPEPGVELAVRGLPDHRLLYLDYEGPIAGDRGSVTAWDRGNYRCLRESDTELAIEFSGGKLRGQATLRQAARHGGPMAVPPGIAGVTHSCHGCVSRAVTGEVCPTSARLTQPWHKFPPSATKR